MARQTKIYDSNIKKDMKTRYHILRNYIKELSGVNAGDVESDIVIKLGLSPGTRLDQWAYGDKAFSYRDTQLIAEYCIEKVKAKASPDELRQILLWFMITQAEASNEANGSIINSFLDELFKNAYGDDIQLSGSKKEYRYTNIPDLSNEEPVIRETLIQEVLKNIKEERVSYISGLPGSGKSFIANHAAKTYYYDRKNGCSVAIWIDCRSGDLTFSKMISNILLPFEMNVANLSLADKESEACRCLMENKSIIVLVGLEGIKEVGERKKILNFLKMRALSGKTAVVITCCERLLSYRKLIGTFSAFSEVMIEKFDKDEWKQLADIFSNSYPDIRSAREISPETDLYVYTLCDGNPFLMTHVLFAVSEKILTGFRLPYIRDNYLVSDFDPSSHDYISGKTFKELSDNCVFLLVTLSLFVTSVPLNLLGSVSGIGGVGEDGTLVKDSDMDLSITKCHNLFLVTTHVDSKPARYSISEMLRPVIRSEILKHPERYLQILNRWINHYLIISKQVGYCYDDYKKLAVLETSTDHQEIENIKYVLSYCEQRKRWQDYYDISKNTKYYFYTRGISGIGKESVHYKRAIAARNLKNYIGEYEALIYHCIVCSKSKSQDSVKECFARIEELLKLNLGIPAKRIIKFDYAKGLSAFSKGDYEKAAKLFNKYEEEVRGMPEIETDKLLKHDYVASLRWHCECIYNMMVSNCDSYLAEHPDILAKLDSEIDSIIGISKEINHERAIVHGYLLKMRICLLTGASLLDCEDILVELDSELCREVVEKDAVYKAEYNIIKKKYNEMRNPHPQIQTGRNQ